MLVKDEQSALIICTANQPDICRAVMTFAAPLAPLRESEATAHQLLGGWGDLLSKGRGKVSLPSCPRHTAGSVPAASLAREGRGGAMLNFE